MKNFENDNLTGENDGGNRANTPVKFLTATTLIGNKVHNPADENLGEVHDFMLDLNTGTIEYVIIEFGGFLGLGEKFFAIPFDVLTLNTERHIFILDVSREQLENAPGFDKDHWPETNSQATKKIYSTWGSFMGPNIGSRP
jgi:sporulation protein YlmC with PRC-barrel domain